MSKENVVSIEIYTSVVCNECETDFDVSAYDLRLKVTDDFYCVVYVCPKCNHKIYDLNVFGPNKTICVDEDKCI